METRRVFQRMFDQRLLSYATSAILSIIVLTAIIFIIYEDTIISDNSVSDVAGKLQLRVIEDQIIKSTISDNLPLRSLEEKATGKVINPLKPPFNVTVEERKAWFRQNLPEFEIFKSDHLTNRFHGRVLEFFDNQCEVQSFMTWISPAKSFGKRETLALESFFKAHRSGCLIILSRTLDTPKGYRILKPLIDRKFKVAAITPDLNFLFRNTPAEAWLNEIKTGNKDPGEIPLSQNLSNLIRLVVLYKYGGIYLDTDFIVLKSFKGLKNSIGAQSIELESKKWTRLNNAVLIFDMNHPLLFKFIEEFAATFDGNKWGHNGPYLVSRVVQRVEGSSGYNFTVLQPMAFYPVDWNKIGGLFKMPKNHKDIRWVNAKSMQLTGESYGVHLWNKQSSGLRIEHGSVMGRLILDHCVICNGVVNSS